MSRKVVSLTLFSMFLLVAMVVTFVVAQVRRVGVSEGDWFKYGDFSANWSSNDLNATLPEWLVEVNETEWMLELVVNVSDTTMTVQSTQHFTNGTEKIQGGYLDVDTGYGENVAMMAISANLEENNTLYTSVDYSTIKINETIARTYPDSARDTNHLNITTETEINQNISMNYYWDKSTGILVEMSQEVIYQTGDYLTSWSTSFRIIDSNVWVVPEFSPILTLPLFMIATLLTVMLYRRKHTRHT